MASRKLLVEIVGDSSSLEKAYAKSTRASSKFGRNMEQTGRKGRSVFSGLGKAIGLASGALGALGLAGAAKAAFTEMADAQKVAAQTEAVLKSTGGAANVTAKQMDTLSESLMRMSGVDDEAIKQGQNLLLTFTKVQNRAGKGNKIFTKATKIMLDMSVALGQDTKRSAIQLGKALNDPIKGITALSRVGVSFDGKQKQLIKTLVATNRTVDAQKVILKELEKEFGGSARAAGQTLPGKLNILRESLLNLGGAIAQKLSPELTRIVDKITAWLTKTENQERVMQAVNDAAAVLGGALKTLRRAFDRLNDITGSTKNTLKLLLGVLVAIKALQMASALARIASGIGLIGRSADTSTGKVKGLGKQLAYVKGFGPTLAVAIVISLVVKNKKQVSDWLKSIGLSGIAHGIQNVGGLIRPVIGRGGTGPSPKVNIPNVSRRTPVPSPPPPPAPSHHGVPRAFAGTVVNVGTVITQDPDRFVREMQKKAARTRAQQRGVRPGVALGGA